jgi:hypothetical protein
MQWRNVGEWNFSFIILELGTACRLMVSFMPRSLYLLEKSRRYRLDRRLGVFQSRCERYVEEKNYAPPGNRTPATQLELELNFLSSFKCTCILKTGPGKLITKNSLTLRRNPPLV